MKVVIEKINDTVYVYQVPNKQFAMFKRGLHGRHLTNKDMENDCDINQHVGDCHIVVNGKAMEKY